MVQALLSLSQNSILHVLRYSLDARLDRESCGGRLVYPQIVILTGQVVENVSVADRPNSHAQQRSKYHPRYKKATIWRSLTQLISVAGLRVAQSNSFTLTAERIIPNA